MDGTTTMSTHERKASIREFYGTFMYPGYLMLRLIQVAFSFFDLTEAKFLIFASDYLSLFVATPKRCYRHRREEAEGSIHGKVSKKR